MADPEKEEAQKRERRNTSGAASRRSGASRPPSPAPLTRYVSGNYIDDQAQYHDHLYHNENEKEKEKESGREGRERMARVRAREEGVVRCGRGGPFGPGAEGQ